MLINVIYVATSQELDVKCSSVFALEKSPPGKDVIYGFPVWSFGLLVKTWSSFFLFFIFCPLFPQTTGQSHNWKPHESATRGNLMGNCDWPTGNAPKSSARGSVFGLCGGAFNVFFHLCNVRLRVFLKDGEKSQNIT